MHQSNSWLLLSLLSLGVVCLTISQKAQSACANTLDCLSQIESHTNSSQQKLNQLTTISSQTTNMAGFWRTYLERYLGLNLATGATLLPATPSIRTALFDKLNEHYQTASQAATKDTQTLLDHWLKNDLTVSTYMQGTLNNITPNISSQTSSLIGSSSSSSPNNGSLNFDTLLTQDAITGLRNSATTQESGNAAKNFIFLVTNVLNSLEFDQEKGSRSNDDWHTYLLNNWGMTAKISLALSNFFHMLRQREIYTNLGTVAGLGKEHASPREIETHLINKRLTASWLQQMEAASPVVIERETLHVLSEMMRLQKRSSEIQERILATVSVNVVQGIEMGKELMKIQEQIKATTKSSQQRLQNMQNFSY